MPHIEKRLVVEWLGSPEANVRLMGGLGNQQYAAARATSLRTGSPLKVDLSWFNDEGSRVTPRRAGELEPFGLSIELASEAELARTLRPLGSCRRRLADPRRPDASL